MDRSRTPRNVCVAFALLVGACADEPGQTVGPRVLSAFFGLDDALPASAGFLCPTAPGKDGMPIVFSVQVDGTTLDASDFVVTTVTGQLRVPDCATLAPAVEQDEQRTVLLMGDLGGTTERAVAMEVVGDLASRYGQPLRGLRHTSITPIEDGPSLVLAELVPSPDPELDGFGGCPSASTAQVVTVTWSGGVRDPSGGQTFDTSRYLVTLRDGTVVSPLELADLGDNDNVQDLCLGSASPAVSVHVLAGTAIDPRGDANPDTIIAAE